MPARSRRTARSGLIGSAPARENPRQRSPRQSQAERHFRHTDIQRWQHVFAHRHGDPRRARSTLSPPCAIEQANCDVADFAVVLPVIRQGEVMAGKHLACIGEVTLASRGYTGGLAFKARRMDSTSGLTYSIVVRMSVWLSMFCVTWILRSGLSIKLVARKWRKRCGDIL